MIKSPLFREELVKFFTSEVVSGPSAVQNNVQRTIDIIGLYDFTDEINENPDAELEMRLAGALSRIRGLDRELAELTCLLICYRNAPFLKRLVWAFGGGEMCKKAPHDSNCI